MYCGASPLTDLKTIDLRVSAEKLRKGFPTKTVDEWSTCASKAATRYNSDSCVLKLLDMINISCATKTLCRAPVSKMGLQTTRVRCLRRSSREDILRMCFKNPIALDTLIDIILICPFLSRPIVNVYFTIKLQYFSIFFSYVFHCTSTSKGTIKEVRSA